MKRATYGSGSISVRLPLLAGFSLTTAIAAQELTEADSGNETVEEIIVTGSRIARDEYSSPSPFQVLDVEVGRQIGITSISELLQRAPVANGTQIDASLNTAANTFNTTEAPAVGGVGSSNISLRGLEPERSLVLVNGRRLGSIGVRGAPAQPDISMIPFDMVERVEVLTEGVSAVYGADAVAGVVNVILRDEFEGLQVTLNAEQPIDNGGQVRQLSIMTGAIGDRASITFAAEYFDRERVKTGDRDFTSCLRNIQITPDGENLTVCDSVFPDSFIFTQSFLDPVTGEQIFVAFHMPDGATDIGIPNFATWQLAVPDPAVVDPRLGILGIGNFRYFDAYNDQDERRAADLIGELERLSVVTTSKFNLDWWANEVAYFEGYYVNNRTFSVAATEQIFPEIAGTISQEDSNGNIIVDANGVPIMVPNPLNPFGVNVVPIVTLESVPQTRDVEREQFRFVAGFKGDIGDSSWNYDGFVSYDRGIGFQAQPILFEDNLILATRSLRLDADGNVICGFTNTTSATGGFDSPNPCVPLNMFANDIYTGGLMGDGVLSDAELNYLIGNRTNRTVVEQSILGGYATGDVFDIGDRTVAAAIGVEYRKDEIDSQNDLTGVQGLNAAESPLVEGQTIGARDIFEIFGEINVPLLDSLQFDAALRYTDEENFGSETTWRTRIAWQPLDYLRLSGSVGTSYRAPNLREQFLADQGGGVAGFFDPCRASSIQQAIFLEGQDDPNLQFLLNNCIAQGVTIIDSDGDGNLDSGGVNSNATIPTSAGGNTTLLPETSESRTATIQFDQPWFDGFDFRIAASYWAIEVENTVEELDVGVIINRCYTDKDFPNGSSPFCDRHTRGILQDGSADSINFFDISFINIGEQTAKGIDLNTQLSYTFDSWNLDFLWSTVMTRQLEQETEFTGPEDRDDNLGEIGTPKIKFTSTLSLLRGDWEVLMQNRFIGDGQQDDTEPDAPNRRWIGSPLSHDVDYVDSVWYTDLSLTYFRDLWSVSVGVNNLFDEPPPLIAGFAGPNRNNAVTSSGYDFFGRSIFATIRAVF